ncbi:MAG: hypothetical protein WDM71_05910 [Ferruginibacter sp.]
MKDMKLKFPLLHISPIAKSPNEVIPVAWLFVSLDDTVRGNDHAPL